MATGPLKSGRGVAANYYISDQSMEEYLENQPSPLLGQVERDSSSVMSTPLAHILRAARSYSSRVSGPNLKESGGALPLLVCIE